MLRMSGKNDDDVREITEGLSSDTTLFLKGAIFTNQDFIVARSGIAR